MPVRYCTALRQLLTRIVSLLLLLPIAAAAQQLEPLQLLAKTGAEVSAVVVDLPEGKVLTQLNPNSHLRPASLTKLFTAAAALKTWGPNKTFATRILGNVPQHGVVNGDLVFVGGGDPALSYSGLWQLAAQLSEAGIKRVTGNLVIDQSLFGNVACQSDDRCDAQDKSRFAYDAPVSAAGINFGTWCVAIAPSDRVGAAADAGLCQLNLPDVSLHGHVVTTKKDQANRIHVSRVSQAGQDRLFLSGNIAANSPVVHIYRSTANAPMQTGQVLREILLRSDIKISGRIRVQSDYEPSKLTPLAHVDSIPLIEQLIRMMTYSNNYMADTLALDILAEDRQRPRPLTLKAAGENLLSVNAVFDGNSTALPVIHSGSGLTPENALSASDIVALLKTMYLHTDLFPAFVGSLTVPKFSPLSIFRGNESGWLTRISAKTGSMQDPVTVVGVAGYFRKQNGGWGAFALMINGTAEHPHIPFSEATLALRQTVNQILKRY